MDRLDSLTNTLSQITMYDIKSMYNQAKNVVLNVSEMEAKVREATNDDPWGASSTLMQEIAQGTFSFQYFNEIMPCIYARFMEKEARQWRQIYKALQLLEYLIKHGSERVVDDARSHISTLKMLRSFHYIDDKGKDEGINVRNRSRELVELLSDVDKIRAERRKAKNNKSKYVGVGNDGMSGMSFNSGGGRYGGFGSDTLGGGSSSYDNYGGGGGGSSSSSRGGGFSDNRRGFEEYNAGDDEDVATSPPATSPRTPSSRTSNSVRNPTRKASVPTPAPPPPAPVEDLLGGFGDDDAFGTSTPTTQNNGMGALATNKALPAVTKPVAAIDDDDFADFQAAPVVAPVLTGGAPTASATTVNANFMQILNATPASRPAPAMANSGFVQQSTYGMGTGMSMGGMHRPSPSLSSQPSQFSSPQPQSQNLFGGASMKSAMSPTISSFGSSPMKPTPAAPTQPSKPTSTVNFDDLWSMSLGAAPSSAATAVPGKKSIKDLEKEKANAGLWGGQKPQQGANAFGAFSDNMGSSSSGADDLLL